MKMAIAVLVGIVLVLGGAYALFVIPRTPAPAPQQEGSRVATTSDSSGAAGIANPASVHCVQELGGQLEIVDTAQGQVGMCRLPDGRVCEEWSLFRDGTCTSASGE